MPAGLQRLTEKNLADRAADQLREAIQTGRLAPGARLVERQLADELGISHIPIREALGRLAEEGLVERLPRRTSRVAVIGHRELEQLASLRTVLEGFVAVRVQQRLTPRGQESLQKLVTAMQAAAAKGDGDRVFELDRRFHERLWALSDHALLLGMVTQLRGRINGFLRAANRGLPADELELHADSHAHLLAAIAGDDAAAAHTAMADHIRIAAERIQQNVLEGTDAGAR